jgi:flagellar basal-body rod modification protein FlgD
MTISAASSTTSTAALTTTTAATQSSSQIDNPSSALSKTDFLQMLITKLKNQDPLDVTNDDFTSEMAQFSTLEAETNTTDGITTLGSKIDDLNTNIVGQLTMENTTQAVSLVGKSVSVSVTDSSGNVTSSDSGTVSAIKFEDGVPKIVVNGVEYDLSTVTEVTS